MPLADFGNTTLSDETPADPASFALFAELVAPRGMMRR
jgi:hypothetical protein